MLEAVEAVAEAVVPSRRGISMKTPVLLIAASAAMVISLAADNTYGMGAKGIAVQQQEKSVSGRSGSERPETRSKEDVSSETSGTVNRNSTAPKKRPRLKYRDEPRCRC